MFTDQKVEFLHAGVEATDHLGVMVLPIIKMSDSADCGEVAVMFDGVSFSVNPESSIMIFCARPVHCTVIPCLIRASG